MRENIVVGLYLVSSITPSYVFSVMTLICKLNCRFEIYIRCTTRDPLCACVCATLLLGPFVDEETSFVQILYFRTYICVQTSGFRFIKCCDCAQFFVASEMIHTYRD